LFAYPDPVPTIAPSRIPDPEGKKAPDPQHWLWACIFVPQPQDLNKRDRIRFRNIVMNRKQRFTTIYENYAAASYIVRDVHWTDRETGIIEF
jgi:hypothetical protein